jgi:peptidoglycan/LPS O-acetylase OafA/YrhL
MFFFLSGFGLFYAIKSNKYLLSEFYYRRFLRIIPIYWLVISIDLIVRFSYGERFSVYSMIFKFSTISFWINLDMFDWYIPVLIVFYILFPLFYIIFDKSSNKKNIILYIIIISLLFCLTVIILNLNYLLPLTLTISIFFIGAYVGHLSMGSGKRITQKQIAINSITLIGSIIVLYSFKELFSLEVSFTYGLLGYPFIIGTFPLCLLFSIAVSKIETNNNYVCKIYHKIRWLLLFCGVHSLEIYLLHQIVFYLGHKFSSTGLLKEAAASSINQGRIIEFLIYFIITLILAILLKKSSLILQKIIIAIVSGVQGRATPERL